MLTSTVGSSSATATASTRQNDLGQKDIFLKLLVAQMEHQDPLKPQDPTQMSSQLAQFNMVEQQTKSNKLLEQLVSSGGLSSGASQPRSGADYLGRTVSVNQSDIFFNGSNQNFSAVLEEPATQARVFIMDESGNPVRTMTLNNLASGANPIVWDGKTDTGATASQGNYTIQISAINLNGGTVSNTVQRSGVVDAVRFTDSGTRLMVGGVSTSIADITEIRL